MERATDADQPRPIQDGSEGRVAQQAVRTTRFGSVAEPVEIGPGFGVMLGAGARLPLLDRLERHLGHGRGEALRVRAGAFPHRHAGEEKDGQGRLKEAGKKASWQQPTRSNEVL